MRSETTMDGGAHAGTTRRAARLDLKLLRLAVHGWWLGNPLIYKPHTTDLVGVARELAAAGARSGTVVLAVAWDDDIAVGDDQNGRDWVQLELILRPALSCAQVGMATALAVAGAAREAAGCACSVEHSWEVWLERGGVRSRVCRAEVEQVEAEQDGAATIIGLHLALECLWSAGPEDDERATTCAARPDRREVFIARVLHRLDSRLRAPHAP